MRFIFYSPVAFEKWDWRNSIETGIGGSETSHVEMAWRLARRGHDVLTYAPVPEDSPRFWRNTQWLPLEDVDTSLSGVWILYRCPEFVDEMPEHAEQVRWLILQDWDYAAWTDERVRRLDRIVPLCQSHRDWIVARHPDLVGFGQKQWITSNGIKLDLIAEVEREAERDGIERNPHRIMHASSPDRGLLTLAKIFRKVRGYVPDAELHAFYGFDNLDKLIAGGAEHLKQIKEDILREADQPGVALHGRVSQPELYREWLKSGIYCYPTSFWETSHISGQEAQALGAVPVFSPIWAQRENIRHGIAVEGDPNDPLTQARFAGELYRLMAQPELQESIREEMVPDARKRFDWENFVTQWEMEAETDWISKRIGAGETCAV